MTGFKAFEEAQLTLKIFSIPLLAGFLADKANLCFCV